MEKLLKNNIIIRVVTSAVFIPLFLSIFDYGGLPYIFLMLGIISILTYEFMSILSAKGLQPYFRIGIFSSILLGFIMNFSSALFTYFFITMLIIFLSVSELRRKDDRKSIIYMSATAFGVIYTGWLGGHMLLIRQAGENMFNSGILIFLALGMIWMGDTGAFIVGSLLGKHKINTRISPSKSFEGLFGGMLFSFLTGLGIKFIYMPFLSVWDCIVLGLIASLAGLAGDFVESAMKRDANIKDVSSFLPGHGGVLDRFDSVLFALPLLYYYFELIVKQRLL